MPFQRGQVHENSNVFSNRLNQMNIIKHVWMMLVPATLEETVNVSAQQWLPMLKRAMSWTSAFHGELHPFVVSFTLLLFEGVRGKENRKEKKKNK